jgi:phosphoserine phosphatase
VIEAGLADFGIAADHVLASRVAVRDGLLTSELIDVPSGPAKRDALIKAGVGMPDAVFGNSVHDAAMLAMAAAPYAVNPTPQLLELAGTERWPVYWPEDPL